jgi:hypothetical protein
MLPSLGKSLILIGVILVLAGLAVLFLPKIPFLGRLPGDIAIRGKSGTFYFPLATSLLISLILTLLFNLFGKK